MDLPPAIVAKRHPHPASPIEGEVESGAYGRMMPNEWRDTSPLMGEVGRG